MEQCPICGSKLEVIKDQPYHYSESGLDVVLLGITQFKCEECGETFASIPQPIKLHKLIGRDICKKKKALLLPEEIKFLRKAMQLKAKDLARALGVTAETVSRWENDREQIGETSDRLLRSIYLLAESDSFTVEDSIASKLSMFTDLPAKRKAIKEKLEIKLNPQEWMMPGGMACPA